MKGLAGGWKKELLSLSLTVMEAAWIAAWFLIAVHPFVSRHPALNLALAVLAALLAISWMVRILGAAGVAPKGLSTIVMILALASGILFVRVHLYPGGTALDLSWALESARNIGQITEYIPAELILILLIFFLWWRGLSLGTREHTFERVGYSFRAGIVLLMWSAAVSAILGWGATILGFAFAYFFFGLLAVGLARVHDLELQPESGGEVSTPFWMGSTLGGIAATLLLALAATQLFTAGNLRAFFRVFDPVWQALERAGLFLANLLGLILQPILDWLVKFFKTHVDPNALTLGTPVPAVTPELMPHGPVTQPAYLEVLKYAFIALFVLGVLALVAFSIQKTRQRALERGRAEEREIDWESSPPGKGLAGALKSRLSKLAELFNLVGQFGLGQKFRAAASIRYIYANLLRWAAERGSARQESQTPYEFLMTLRGAFPTLDGEMQSVTEAYVRSHYGQVPDTDTELQKIRSCWERIQESAY